MTINQLDASFHTAGNVRRTERGYAGHFCAAQHCLFRRNTLLELGDVRVVVSTVGNMWLPEHGKAKRTEPEEIGLDRVYETMAFHAVYEKPYWEADVSRAVEFDSQWAIARVTLSSDADADAMHEAVVAELSQRLKAGTVTP